MTLDGIQVIAKSPKTTTNAIAIIITGFTLFS